MMNRQRIDEEVEKTLHALDDMERAEPMPFFLTRAEGRLARRMAPNLPPIWVFRPAWIMASLGLVLVLNLSAVVYVREQMAQHEQEQDVVGLTSEWRLDATLLD